MTSRASAALLGCIAVLAGCSSGTSAGRSDRSRPRLLHRQLPEPGAPPARRRRAHRREVRHADPREGSGLPDPLRRRRVRRVQRHLRVPRRHLVESSRRDREGLEPAAALRRQVSSRATTSARQPVTRSADASSANAPTIERPDLVGVQNGIGIFLSKQHGLMAVDARGAAPVVSCSMKLPGEPKNFLFKGNELVIVVNGRAGQQPLSAAPLLVRRREVPLRRLRSPRGPGRHGRAPLRLHDRRVHLVVQAAASSRRARPDPRAGRRRRLRRTAPRALPRLPRRSRQPYRGDNHLGSKLIVVQWDSELKIDYEDALLDDVAKQDPLEGTVPGTKYTQGQLISERKTFKSFVTASDRYIVVPRDVQQDEVRALRHVQLHRLHQLQSAIRASHSVPRQLRAARQS